jgi:hypothetical protein
LYSTRSELSTESGYVSARNSVLVAIAESVSVVPNVYVVV